ncbi:cation-translocating P-type ATPase [Geodermatophilus sp. SYSU D00965]
MGMLRRIDAARGAAGAAARLGIGLAAAPALVTAGLLGGPARATVRTAGEVTTAAVGAGRRLAHTAAVTGARTVGTVLTGADPVPDGHLHSLLDAARGMVEPPKHRHTRRVWADRGHVQLEVCAPSVEEQPEVRRALRRQLERLEGVQWATVNDVVGRVFVAFDERRVGIGDVVGAVTAIEQARGGAQVFPESVEHPADLEPLLAAAVAAAVDTASVGVAYLAKVLPIPAVSRHVTLAIALLDSQRWVRSNLEKRIGVIGTDLVFNGTSAFLHALTQSPAIPALNAAAAIQQVVELRARRQVWQRREAELCGPEPEDESEPLTTPGKRPQPLPDGPVETYRARLEPISLAAALGMLPLTASPGRAADMLKSQNPKAAGLGRESFGATLDLLMCRRGVLPLDGSAYRRLDRVDTVVLDAATLCTGPPVVIEATATAEGWDDAAVWTAAVRLLGEHDAAPDGDDDGEPRLRLGPARTADGAEGGEVRSLLRGRRRVGVVTIAPELDPHAEALMAAASEAGHRLVLPRHVGTREVAGAADEVAPAGEQLVETVRRLQAEGRAVLLVSATDGPALMAADVAIAPVVPGCAPAWGADLVTGPGLVDACALVAATVPARSVSRRSVTTAVTGNVLGGLLAAVGSARYGQAKATAPGKTASTATLVDGALTAVRAARRPVPPPSVHTPWHALDPDDVLARLADLPQQPDGPDGRVPGAVRVVRSLPVVRVPARFLRTVAAELADPLTPVLATGAGATAALGENTDALLVGGVTVMNALVSGLQRLRAETALEALLLEQDVTVRREVDGRCEDVPASALRVGDVVCVAAGDVVAADARLLEANDLEVDESNLTGESLPVAKTVPATPGADVADRTCVLHDGTTVVAGSGRAVVVAVGSATQAGRAARAAGGAAPPAGVQARLAELTRAVLPLTLAGGAAVTALGVLWRRPLREAVAAGVAVAVAAVPEGLPLVATVAQQAAARRLSRRGAVVRSARVLEALGRVDTVCFDKTGTLTENRLRLVRLLPLGEGADATDEDDVLRLAAAGVANGDARAHETDRAVVEAAEERGVDPDGAAQACVPFAADRGFSAAVRDGRLLVKGAPEVVAARCAGSPDVRSAVQELAADGLRVLAVADRDLDGVPDDLEAAAHDLRLRGLVGLADTLRESSVTAIEQLRAAGVRVVLATGDHPETAGAIAAQAGVPGADRVVTGAQFARASDSERAQMVREGAVFARLSPEQKVSLVSALRRAGATLAMTGDGVNDAAAIRLADVGIGVSGAESPAARAAADLVLTDLDLTRLVDAIGEGRAMWRRVRDAVSILVGGNAGEVAFTVLGTAFGGRAPLGTRQLLLVNLLTDMFPALAVAVASPRAAVLEQSEGPLAGHPLEAVLRAGPQRGFSQGVRRMVVVRGAATAAGATGAWAAGRLTGPAGRAGTMGLAALIATQLGQTAWAGRRSPLVLATAAGSLAVLVALVSTPGVSRFFGCTPLDPLTWGVVLGWAAAGTVGAEVVPALLQRYRARAGG